MKTIKINYCDYHVGYDFRQDLIFRILSKKYNVVLSDKPDYVFYSCFGFEHLNIPMDCITIFVTGEDQCPDFNLCDYALGFEYLNFGDRYMRFPLYYFYLEDMERMQTKHIISNDYQLKKEKPGFCSFVVSNGNGSNIRECFFKLLSKYKQVDSGGKFLNNIGGLIMDKLKFDSKHKFSICFENTSHSGYSTEKLVQAFAAQTIPIYWGDPEITRVFNPESFINIHDFNSLEDVVKKVIEIDQNDYIYLQMLKTPALISYDYSESVILKQLESFLYNIIEQPKESAYRRSRNFHQLRYKGNRQFLYNRSQKVNKILSFPLFRLFRKM